MDHVTRMHESFSHMNSLVTRVDESRLTHECRMGPFCCTVDESGDEGVISHVRPRHVPRMNESSHTYARVTSHA